MRGLILTPVNGYEIFSNLRFTQAIYDALAKESNPDDLLERDAVIVAAQSAYQKLIAQEPVIRDKEYLNKEADTLKTEVVQLYSKRKDITDLLSKLDMATRAYTAKAREGK
jgi:hypothetical protein